MPESQRKLPPHPGVAISNDCRRERDFACRPSGPECRSLRPLTLPLFASIRRIRSPSTIDCRYGRQVHLDAPFRPMAFRVSPQGLQRRNPRFNQPDMEFEGDRRSSFHAVEHRSLDTRWFSLPYPITTGAWGLPVFAEIKTQRNQREKRPGIRSGSAPVCPKSRCSSRIPGVERGELCASRIGVGFGAVK